MLLQEARGGEHPLEHRVRLAQVLPLDRRRVRRQRAVRPHAEAGEVASVVEHGLQRLDEVDLAGHRRDDLAPHDPRLVAADQHVVRDVLRRLAPAAEGLAQHVVVREHHARAPVGDAPHHPLQLLARRVLTEAVRQLGAGICQLVVELERDLGELVPDGLPRRVVPAEADVLAGVARVEGVEAQEPVAHERLRGLPRLAPLREVAPVEVDVEAVEEALVADELALHLLAVVVDQRELQRLAERARRTLRHRLQRGRDGGHALLLGEIPPADEQARERLVQLGHAFEEHLLVPVLRRLQALLRAGDDAGRPEREERLPVRARVRTVEDRQERAVGILPRETPPRRRGDELLDSLVRALPDKPFVERPVRELVVLRQAHAHVVEHGHHVARADDEVRPPRVRALHGVQQRLQLLRRLAARLVGLHLLHLRGAAPRRQRARRPHRHARGRRRLQEGPSFKFCFHVPLS